ncbi:hypothetical protein BG015_009161 [Linnemannia schmuckeri]|uniref:Prenylcysteine lyase domain-containing protein n=1 Tax=Linnemannia schmuckeri TaxID=64567 RepID=A0A9P5RWE1_9FUNG|nr:hypothetical protein BG015_009161 [Linnemannia schmuckeri]
MRIGYFSKVGAAVTAFFTPSTFQLSGGPDAAKELAPTKSVAIIGAGAGGSSTAFYLQKLLQPEGEPLHKHQLLHPTTITIFDQSDKIGGRCQVFFTTNPADPEKNKPEEELAIEVGASIFVKVNHHLADSTKEFGLKVKKLDNELLAIWDGNEFLFVESPWRFWSILKGLARWGLAPIKLNRLLKSTVDNLLHFYTSPESYTSIHEFSTAHNLHTEASILTHEYLESKGINKQYAQEVVEVATRVNYGSNLDGIHALGALVTMAANDAQQIEGGNFQIFEGMVAKSGAEVRLETKIARVRRLEPQSEGEEPQFEVTTTTGQKQIFDYIVLAAPIDSTNIDFDISLPPQPKVDYRTIHATFVRGNVNPSYFYTPTSPVRSSTPSAKDFPSHILSTNARAEFTSLSIQARLSNGETITKIFSPKELSKDLLDRLYSNRTWVKHKEWKAYPKLRPIPLQKEENGAEPEVVVEGEDGSGQTVFEKKHAQKKQGLDAQKKTLDAWGQVEVVPGVFYVNSFEPLISTMETETIAGKNIARLLRDRIVGHCPVEKNLKR